MLTQYNTVEEKCYINDFSCRCFLGNPLLVVLEGNGDKIGKCRLNKFNPQRTSYIGSTKCVIRMGSSETMMESTRIYHDMSCFSNWDIQIIERACYRVG